LDADKARTMLVDTLKWRESFKVDSLAIEDFPTEVFGGLGHIYGTDKTGHPITYNLYGGGQDLKAIFSDTDRFLRWRVAFMEKGVKLLDFRTIDSLTQVHDYEGVTMSSRDENSKKAASEATKLFSDYYPEFLHQKFFVNVPTILTWVYWIFKSIVPSKTFAKMQVVGSGPQTIGKTMLEFVDKSQLPKRYGGDAEAF